MIFFRKNLSKYIIIEISILIILLITFLIIGIVNASRLYPVWLDEVTLTEPASNLYFNNSFTSASWYHQTSDEFHVSTSFLYTILLSCWFKILGFSLLSARLFNYILMIISSLILWLAVFRLNLITFSWLRIFLVISFLLTAGITFNYISGRYDVICILLSLSVLLVYSIHNSKWRYSIIIFLGILFPLAGLSSIVFFTILSIILLVYNYRLFWREYIFINVGFLSGIIFLYFIYSINNVWDDFLSMSLGHSVASSNSDINLFAKFIDKISQVFNQQNTEYLCRGCLDNFTWQFLVIILFILLFYEILTKIFSFRSPISFGVVTIIIIPITMCFLGKYPIYYSWMSIIPLIISIGASLNKILLTNQNFWSKKLILLVCFILWVKAMSYGLPQELKNARYNWDKIDYEKVENFVKTNIDKNDVVYGDFSTFYAVKPKAKNVFFPLYHGLLTDDDKEKLSVIIIDPRETVRADYNPDVLGLLGEKEKQWFDTGKNLDTGIYNLKIYRKNINNE
ncbi:hypothetical protein [Geminocystis sp. NIES-3709]|uniref:hypothetical protein n=1 Tax=Geminocystis sp. NIES-3709 TaxID=1617448 RepID=UPI0005FCC93E|nr:hypothetical protein [Geminocystis sp. NIES-3709]BAQ66224.1 hypothetical protein GM3709_2989 [Geminocystis sp. NIES-3709]